MCTYRKVGTFTRVPAGGRRLRKLGGNVASYVVTPEGRVIHAIPGNVPGVILAQEVAWARGLYRLARVASGGDPGFLAMLLRAAYQGRAARVTSLQQLFALECRCRQLYSVAQLDRVTWAPALLQWALMANQLYPRAFAYLAQHAGEDLARVYPYVWTRIVRERLSEAPVQTLSLETIRCIRCRIPRRAPLRLGTLVAVR